MQIEYEATFTDIDKDDMRARLRKAGAKLLRPEFLQKRVVFKLPAGHEIEGGWLRVRDEGDKITMTLKAVKDGKIEDQKEITLQVDNFQQAEYFLTSIGCQKKAYQENRREVWDLDGVEVDLDEWPFLPPYVEVEGASEDKVKQVSKKLGFDYTQAKFCAADTLYNLHYGVSKEMINNQIPLITFEMDNPFNGK
ncbi:CYTH domain-containing protein [Patescibacteria group bacterium]|nr:MAG: CYTH domain-containing protein [Patescibacteria group bacterium]